MPTFQQHICRQQLEDELVNLNKKVCQLEQQLEEVTRCHDKELEETRASVRKELENEHHQKFSQVSRQIQTLQHSELESLRKQLVEEYSRQIAELEEKHKKILFDVQESHKLEVTELDRKYVNMTNDNKNEKLKQASEITPDVYEAMRADIDKLEEEKFNLRSMQILMKDLMKDLAIHYDLSEKQVKFLSDSVFLDSFSILGVSRSQFNTPTGTPFKYFQKQEIIREAAAEDENDHLVSRNLTENLHKIRLEDTETSHIALESMISTVKRSNTDLEDLQLKLETISSSTELNNHGNLNPLDDKVMYLKSSDFVGIEAGRLEVERSRLEAGVNILL